jgi:hypothetical protein
MHEPGPISLSDEQLSVVTRLAEPLAPPDRSAFLAALAQLLRHEPQPLGDGVVFRSAKQLLATGHYSRSTMVAVGTAAPRHQAAGGATTGKGRRSKLLQGAAIRA